jgi:hypothetical protein
MLLDQLPQHRARFLAFPYVCFIRVPLCGIIYTFCLLHMACSVFCFNLMPPHDFSCLRYQGCWRSAAAYIFVDLIWVTEFELLQLLTHLSMLAVGRIELGTCVNFEWTEKSVYCGSVSCIVQCLWLLAF